MRLYFPVDLTGNVNMIEKLALGGTGTGGLKSRYMIVFIRITPPGASIHAPHVSLEQAREIMPIS